MTLSDRLIPLVTHKVKELNAKYSDRKIARR